MTLYERRSSMEHLDRWDQRSASPTGSERRKLSFNPLAEWSAPAVQEEQTVGAHQVSQTKRILQVVIAATYCLLAAGVVFGFAALKPVLINEGVYRDRCTRQELEEGVYGCYEQELRLNFMFTVAAVSTNVCALPVGTVLDRFGPRVASVVGAVFLTLGALSMAFAQDLPFDAYIPGYLFLALGGPFVFISSFQLSNTFPKHPGLILALLTGAFDTSSAVFLGYRLAYQGSHQKFTPKKFFLVYLVVPAFILIAQLLIMPSSSYKTVGELVHEAENPVETSTNNQENGLIEHRDSRASEITELLGSKNGENQVKTQEDTAAKSGVWGALHGKTAWQQICSPWFVLITLFTVVQMTRINYFVATLRTQYTSMLHSPQQARQINEFFDIGLPLGGVIAVPFIGLVLDHTSTPFVLGLLVTIATAIGALGLVPQMWAAYANVCLFVVYRPLYYTAVSDYSAKVFGFDTFGKVYGLIICLAGLFNFSQAGLDTLTHRAFGDDPIPVNVILLSVALIVGLALVGYVGRKSYTMHREKLDEEAEEARETLMPQASGDEVDRPHGHQTYGTA
ncbi:MFS general substrate transporter [Teratosphaeria nubilosa]|uniref:MFS general substrate transporter n=1 Tax=Teratosphaeria nubilosa TaxID=161662 RepID=A0A6G1KV13_9PEZI|nr:MFS general substrate transporter [Teratosphaeria nubilosa]